MDLKKYCKYMCADNYKPDHLCNKMIRYFVVLLYYLCNYAEGFEIINTYVGQFERIHSIDFMIPQIVIGMYDIFRSLADLNQLC